MSFSQLTLLSNSKTQASTRFEGTTTFKLPPSQSYQYSLLLNSGKLRISLEDYDSKKKWCTDELELENYVNSSNSIPDACVSDYVECFHELLTKPLDDKSKFPRALQNANGDRLQLEIYVNVQVLMKYRTATFTFKLSPISVERIDILESKVQDLQKEVKCIRAEDAGKHAEVHDLQKTVSDLRAELTLLRETKNYPGIFLARATSQHGLEGVILWRGEGLKISGGAIQDLQPGVYQVNVTVDFEGRGTSRMQLNKGTQLICSTSGFQQVTLTSIIHVSKGDQLSVYANGNVSVGYMTLALLAMLTV